LKWLTFAVQDTIAPNIACLFAKKARWSNPVGKIAWLQFWDDRS